MASLDHETASPPPAAPIYARFARLSTLASSHDGSPLDSDSVRAQLGQLKLNLAGPPTSPRPSALNSGAGSPWNASPSSFYQATFDSTPQLGRQASYGFGSPAGTPPASSGADLVDRQPTSPKLGSPTLNRPAPTPAPLSRKSSILSGFLKRRPSQTSASSSTRATSPLGRGTSPASTPRPVIASAPRLSPLAFARQGSDQLKSIDEMNLLGRGDKKARKAAAPASGPAPVAPLAEAGQPQLRIARRFGSNSSPTQPQPQTHPATKPLPFIEASSIPASMRPEPGPPVSPARLRPSAGPSQTAQAPSLAPAQPPFPTKPAPLENADERASSEDMQHSSSASSSLPQTPVDEQREWAPRKQTTCDSVPSRLPPGASPSAYQSPYSSPSPTSHYSPQTSSPFTPPLSPSQSLNGSGSGYNPMAAFFGSASPPLNAESGYASPPPMSPSTPVGPRAPLATQREQPSPVLRTSPTRVPQPPAMYSDQDEDPYREFKPKACTSPTSPTLPRELKSKNSFFTSPKVAPPKIDELPPLPTSVVTGSRVAAAVQAAEAQRSPTSSEATVSSTAPHRYQKRRPSETDQPLASKIPISPAAKLAKMLPPAPAPHAPAAALTSPPKPQALPPTALQPAMRAPSVGNLRAAALAQSASRHQAAEPVAARAPSIQQAPEPTVVAAEVEAEVVAEEEEEEEETPLAPRFEDALSDFPTTILAPILAQLDYSDFRALRAVSKTMLRSVEGSASEIVLQRFLGPYGYRTLNPAVGSGSVVMRGAGSVVIHSTRQTEAELTARRRFGGSEAGHGSTYTSSAKSAAAKADSNARGGVALTIKDLHAFQVGRKIEVMAYAKMARDEATHQLPPGFGRLARASTRAYNRVVLRLRAQCELERDPSQPRYLFRGVLKAAVPVFKAGRAPMLRVWVPTAKGQSWMGDEELVECEREVWRAGLWHLLRRGDLVHNVAIGDFANDGKLVSDGKYLRDLEFKFDPVGHCPDWIDMLAFAPGYHHNLIASSTNNPVFYLSLKPFAGKIRDSLLLCTDKVQVSSPQGNYLVKRFVYRGAAKVRPGTIIGSGGGAGGAGPGGIEVVHQAWAGQIVVETEGTTEHASMLLERCESAAPTPWVVLRDKSRPDCIWLRPVTDDEAI